jgi:hypothetical protein
MPKLVKIPWNRKKLWPKNIESLTAKNTNKNKKKTDETLQEQKDIPITWGCPN